MRIPALPETVRLVPAEYQETNEKDEPTGVPKPDAPVGVFRPVTGIEQAEVMDAIRRDGPSTAFAQLAKRKNVTWENVHVGEPPVPYNPELPAHVDAIDGPWWVDCGRELYARLHLTEKDAGK